MPEEIRLQACSYFLVRYVPDPVRDEGLNIGVFFHSPEQEYLDCLVTNDFSRVRRLHPQADLEFLHELPEYFEQQIKAHERDLESFIHEMQESYSNLIQVTPPRPCLAGDPQAEMRELFARLVGDRAEVRFEPDTRMRIRQAATAAFGRAGLLKLKSFERHVPAEQWTAKGDPFTFDYGYRPRLTGGKAQGLYKLIHTLSLNRDGELAKALVYTLGQARRKEPAVHLATVVKDRASVENDTAGASQQTLESAGIQVVPLAEVDGFAQSVYRELVT